MEIVAFHTVTVPDQSERISNQTTSSNSIENPKQRLKPHQNPCQNPISGSKPNPRQTKTPNHIIKVQIDKEK